MMTPLKMLMGLSWLGGMIQIAVDNCSQGMADPKPKQKIEEVKKTFTDQITQTSAQYSMTI